MVKTYVPDQLLAEWFIKSLLPSITKDVAKGGFVIEEKVIANAQYLDLIYTQSGTLYDKITDAPRMTFTIPQLPKSSRDSHASDDVMGSSSTQTTRGPSSQTLSISNQNANPSENTLASEINVVSSDKGKNPKQPRGKKKGKNNKKKHENSTPEKSSESPTRARKPHIHV